LTSPPARLQSLFVPLQFSSSLLFSFQPNLPCSPALARPTPSGPAASPLEPNQARRYSPSWTRHGCAAAGPWPRRARHERLGLRGSIGRPPRAPSAALSTASCRLRRLRAVTTLHSTAVWCSAAAVLNLPAWSSTGGNRRHQHLCNAEPKLRRYSLSSFPLRSIAALEDTSRPPMLHRRPPLLQVRRMPSVSTTVSPSTSSPRPPLSIDASAEPETAQGAGDPNNQCPLSAAGQSSEEGDELDLLRLGPSGTL
jgi:hypothetical protein